MSRIKRLYSYILQAFIPMFLMTFGICLFIVLMQFLWKYVEDLVGKGLSTIVLGELFTYAALSLIPMALPLAILLASLMTFGNLGERLELLAIKAAGISLLKAMRPLIIFIALVSIGAFFFQNEAMPRINVKFRSLLISIKQKSPELDIPEGTFYSDIKNYNLYVKKKNPKTAVLYDVKIYDVSKGFDNMAVIISDSAKMRMSSHKDYLILNLFYGQQFANFQKPGSSSNSRDNKFVPYSRENFREKEIIIPFDADFNRMDESAFQSTQIAKNIVELRSSIDSIRKEIDSMNVADRKIMLTHTYKVSYNADTVKAFTSDLDLNFDSIVSSLSLVDRASIYSSAISQSEMNKNDFMFRSMNKLDSNKKIRQHEVELHRKFVLSFACLIFFFIGAPLGAIIRKGGMGMPVVISVILFIIYYIIDNVGYKMARDGVWEVWQGAWLSSFILFPLGVFLTYKAMNDSELFKPEAYGKFLRKILFVKSPVKTSKEEKNIRIANIPDIQKMNVDPAMLENLELMDNEKLKNIVLNYKDFDYGEEMQLAALSLLKNREADLMDIIDQQDYKYSEQSLNYFSSNSKIAIVVYLLLIVFLIIKTGVIFDLIGISYIALYLRSMIYYYSFYEKSVKRPLIYHIIVSVSSLVCFPVMYFYMNKQMVKDLKKIEMVPFKS